MFLGRNINIFLFAVQNKYENSRKFSLHKCRWTNPTNSRRQSWNSSSVRLNIEKHSIWKTTSCFDSELAIKKLEYIETKLFYMPCRRSRPTLKPSGSIVSKAQEFVDIYRFPPSRPEPLYPQPTPDKTAAKCRKDVCLLPDCSCGGKDIPGMWFCTFFTHWSITRSKRFTQNA